jgi:hypothetical protein
MQWGKLDKTESKSSCPQPSHSLMHSHEPTSYPHALVMCYTNILDEGDVVHMGGKCEMRACRACPSLSAISLGTFKSGIGPPQRATYMLRPTKVTSVGQGRSPSWAVSCNRLRPRWAEHD